MISLKERIQIRLKVNALTINKKYDEAIRVFQKALHGDKSYLWYELFIGDLFRYYKNDEKTAFLWYSSCYQKGEKVFNTTPYTPLRYLLKRLSEIEYNQGNYENAVKYYEEFILFRPSNFHEGDFLRYSDSLMQIGKKEKAIEVLLLGKKFSKSRDIRRKLNELNDSTEKVLSISKSRNGYERIPVKTRIIKPGEDVPSIVDELTKKIRKPMDIITVASCVVAVAEQRMKTIDVLHASKIATFLSSFVHNDDFDFGGNAPLCNPMSMQMAIDESGLTRIVFAAVFGGVISKLFKGSGMFYRMAGEQAALIDDMPGAISPFDYSIILGPKDSDETSAQIKNKTLCDAAIIDANDLNIAWVVGSSNHSLDESIKGAMDDNPAGNGDQQTPIIILRPA
ncbi:MAG: coenzyme F420-0:L-glutamate ligase [Caldisericia bacterium]|nr:coenzyme F420-0:L-glutamate ligase [Caldisericia bacterium]